MYFGPREMSMVSHVKVEVGEFREWAEIERKANPEFPFDPINFWEHTPTKDQAEYVLKSATVGDKQLFESRYLRHQVEIAG